MNLEKSQSSADLTAKFSFDVNFANLMRVFYHNRAIVRADHNVFLAVFVQPANQLGGNLHKNSDNMLSVDFFREILGKGVKNGDVLS